jgi:hypothetical protein
MPEIVEQKIRTISPNAHPHVLLHYLGKPADGLPEADATRRLHEVIADTSDGVLADAADKLTDYCVPLEIGVSERFEVSQTCFSEMKSIRDRVLHPPLSER